jgi:hypothetical protein
MTDARPLTPSRWCIVVADAAGPEWLVPDDSRAQWTPVQYCSLGEPTTMLQKALHRAGRISHATHVVVTVAEALALEASHVAPRMSWDRPPRIPLRVLCVAHCGWSGLRSPRAIERIATSHPHSSKCALGSSAIGHGHAT